MAVAAKFAAHSANRGTELKQVLPSYLKFWGKAGGADEGANWHPVAYHSLDVAAVAEALLGNRPRRLGVMAKLLKTSPENARRFLVCLIALHDVGKFSKDFQAKSEAVWPETVEPLLGAWSPPPACRHDAVGYDMREELRLRALMEPATQAWLPSDFNTIWAAVTGHHGQPRNDDGRATERIVGLKPACLNPARAFAADIRKLLRPLETIAQPSEADLAILSWQVCGLTVVADWIGSNREWFDYRAPDLRVQEYWAEIQPFAAKAIKAAGLLPSKPAGEVTAARLLPEIAASLSPLQQHVRDMALPDGASLTIIEDVTGSGKTEAAILLAARLIATGRANGLFFALPTMATANAMYERLSGAYARLFADGERPSLVLGHGKRFLNDAFTQSVLASPARDDGYEEGAGAACAAWIADDRRKVFLAETGIGTIDQALLGVLPSRHQVLRLWGLSDRVLIIDEAHAYDAYMAREMERQLEFHAALGGSAIILSATLPDRQRSSLAAAFARGLGGKHRHVATLDYPLVTTVSRVGVAIEPLPTRSDRARRLPVRRIGSFDEAAEHIHRMVAAGCSAAWIRNSVDDAIEAAAALQARGHSPVLLHARFAMGDRLDIEEKVRATLGRVDKTGGRAGFLVVGTQILEQSLDYDVDAMVTDLAPIDLVIQRAGRLWRHTDRKVRPIAEAQLCVLAPDPAVVEDRDWYRGMSRRAAAVYSHHGLVWRSAKVLFDRGAIETPAGVRGLIEEVYGVGDLDDVPEALRKASQDALGKDGAARSFANANLLDLRVGYGGAPNIWTKDTITPTRLGDPVTVFRLGRIEDGAVVPWYADPNPARAWALSEVSLSRRRTTGVPPPDDARTKMITAAKAGWPKWEQDMPLLVLEAEVEGWRGAVERLGEGEKPVIYDRRIGLRLV